MSKNENEYVINIDRNCFDNDYDDIDEETKNNSQEDVDVDVLLD